MSLVIGSIALDTIANRHGRRERLVGGSTPYFAYAASLFEKPKIIGVIGEDFPGEILREMEEKGMDTRGILRERGKTFFWEGAYSEDFHSRETITTELNVFESFRPTLPEGYREERNVFLANISPSLQRDVLDQLGKDRFIVMDTMNLWINTARKDLEEVIGRVNGFILNDEEASGITGCRYVMDAAEALKKRGPDFIIIKKGEHGSLLLTDQGFILLPAFPKREVVDPTGAGDSYAGALMGYLQEAGEISPLSLKRAMVYGTIVSSFTLEDFGLERLRRLTRQEVEERRNLYLEMLSL